MRLSNLTRLLLVAAAMSFSMAPAGRAAFAHDNGGHDAAGHDGAGHDGAGHDANDNNGHEKDDGAGHR